MKKSMSYSLLSGLIAVSFILINCQKAPDRRGVKGTTAPGTSSPNGKTQGDNNTAATAKLPTENCKPESIKQYNEWYKEMKGLGEKVVKRNAEKNEDEKKAQTQALKEVRVSFLKNCDETEKNLSAYENASCYLVAPKNEKEKADRSKVAFNVTVVGLCNTAGTDLEKENGEKNSYAERAAKAAAEARASGKETSGARASGTETSGARAAGKETSAVVAKAHSDREAFKQATLLLSEEGKALLRTTGRDWNLYLVGGNIRQSDTLDQDLRAGKSVCSFIGTGISVTEKETVTLKYLDATVADKKDMPEEFNGIGVSLSVSITTKETGAAASSPSIVQLACANLKAEEFSVAKLRATFGNHILPIKAEEKKEEAKEAKKEEPKKPVASGSATSGAVAVSSTTSAASVSASSATTSAAVKVVVPASSSSTSAAVSSAVAVAAKALAPAASAPAAAAKPDVAAKPAAATTTTPPAVDSAKAQSDFRKSEIEAQNKAAEEEKAAADEAQKNKNIVVRGLEAVANGVNYIGNSVKSVWNSIFGSEEAVTNPARPTSEIQALEVAAPEAQVAPVPGN